MDRNKDKTRRDWTVIKLRLRQKCVETKIILGKTCDIAPQAKVEVH